MGQASGESNGHGWQDTSHGNPKRRKDVQIEIVQARKTLQTMPFLRREKKKGNKQRRMAPINYTMLDTGIGNWCKQHKSENITYSLMRL